MRETHQHGTRRGKSFSIDRQTEPLVMHSEISGLPDKHAFLKLGNNVARFSLTYTDLPATSAAFRPRAVEDDELTFDPLTLEQRGASVQQCMAADKELLADPEDQPTDKEKQEQGSIEVSDTTAPTAAAVASARSRQRTRSLFRCEGRPASATAPQVEAAAREASCPLPLFDTVVMLPRERPVSRC